jgi:hypothetical protein
MRLASLAIAVTAAAAAGCEVELGQAFDDVRAGAPAVCKDYCEEKASCEWPKADGPEEDAAFSAVIRQCTVSCAWYASEGAYVTEYVVALEKTNYVEHVSGGKIETALECIYGASAYHCNENEDAPDSYIFEPRLQVQCDKTAACLEPLAIDFAMVWDESGEVDVCRPEGQQLLEVPFF